MGSLPRLGSTIAGLVDNGRDWAKLMAAGQARPGTGATVPALSVLRRVTDFGSDPGDLEMYVYAPARLAPDPALVVVLHGCTQDAAGYDAGSGWSTLADRHGFVLVFPQQRASNNPKLCFDWFQPNDIARDHGEAMSIRQMVERAVLDHGLDRGRVFVTGLSAGGAMAAVMLATYPEVFAGGAVIAGLPYGAARNVQQALEAMFQGRTHTASEWGDLVRSASAHRGPWPRLSVWHGAADAVVKPGNAAELVKQWTDLHGLPAEPSARDTRDGVPHAVWRDASGRDVVESFTIAGMGHGTPLAVGTDEGSGESAAPYMLDVGISSSHHIACFWGLTGTVMSVADPAPPRETEVTADTSRPAQARQRGPAAAPVFDVAGTIQNALKSAGLMKD